MTKTLDRSHEYRTSTSGLSREEYEIVRLNKKGHKTYSEYILALIKNQESYPVSIPEAGPGYKPLSITVNKEAYLKIRGEAEIRGLSMSAFLKQLFRGSLYNSVAPLS